MLRISPFPAEDVLRISPFSAEDVLRISPFSAEDVLRISPFSLWNHNKWILWWRGEDVSSSTLKGTNALSHSLQASQQWSMGLTGIPTLHIGHINLTIDNIVLTSAKTKEEGLIIVYDISSNKRTFSGTTLCIFYICAVCPLSTEIKREYNTKWVNNPKYD